MTRRDKINYYLDIAETVSERCTCLRRRFGAIIVKNDEIVATGYNGAPRGRKNCVDLGYCRRQQMNVPRGERQEICRAVHAEANAIISASRRDCMESTLYLCGAECDSGEYVENSDSCASCKKLIINAGITTVITRIDKNNFRVIDVDEEWIDNDDSLTDKTGY